MKKKEVRYSEAFKLQVVEDLERGRYQSCYEASEAYGIRGHGTVERWLEAYGKGHLIEKAVRVEKPGEPGQVRLLKERVRQLEKALADLHMDNALNESFFELLCEQSGTDAAAFKKKHGGAGLSGRRSG